MMSSCWEALLLLWLTAVAAEPAEALVNLTNKFLQVIPHNSQNATITKLLIGGNLVTLNETDQLALASYPKLAELHLDANRITAIPAKYFSVVPNLRVLSLARNNISSLDPEAFAGLAVLTDLDLSNNLLSSFPAHTPISGLNKLQILKLRENPWNCSCPLLTIITEIHAANITTGPPLICASPAEQAGTDLLNATATCSTALPAATAHPQKSPTRVSYQQSQRPFIVMMSTTSPNHSLSKDQTPVLGNTWKFTACVAVLALTTSALIVCAIKGPSWYKLFHNYRHRRLQQEVNEEDDEDVMATDFSDTGKHLTPRTFTFEQENGPIEEEEEYYEDPYIRGDEANSYQQQETTPNHVQYTMH